MMAQSPKSRDQADEFFIGWSGSAAPGLARFLLMTAIAITLFLAAMGYFLSRSADDPSAFLVMMGEAAADGMPTIADDIAETPAQRGYITVVGYPLLHIAPDEQNPLGRVIMLAGEGKSGAETGSSRGPAEAPGMMLRRGKLEMLVTNAPTTPLAPDEPGIFPAAHEPLGRWRIVGEICDGKCYAGAMRPGSGLAHKACANLCLSGDIPAVFVTAAPVEGASYLLIAAVDGGPVPEDLRKFVGIPVEIEGYVERLGNILILRVDLSKVRPV